MKRLFSCLLALALLLASGALADVGARLKVVNCKEYITLREEPSTSAAALDRIPLSACVDELSEAENGFMQVSYRGKTGYALGKYLSDTGDFAGESIDCTREQRYNFNLFLSNFAEQGFLLHAGCYDESWVDPALLTGFAVNHCWFNRQNQLEWGDYFNGNNVRLPESQIAPVVQKYFGVTITPSHKPLWIDYRKGYYYWEETGGHVKDGFASLYDVQNLGGGRYAVYFKIYGMGSDWTNDVSYYDAEEAESAYPLDGSRPCGFAVIDTGDNLDDRSGWHIARYAVCWAEV